MGCGAALDLAWQSNFWGSARDLCQHSTIGNLVYAGS